MWRPDPLTHTAQNGKGVHGPELEFKLWWKTVWGPGDGFTKWYFRRKKKNRKAIYYRGKNDTASANKCSFIVTFLDCAGHKSGRTVIISLMCLSSPGRLVSMWPVRISWRVRKQILDWRIQVNIPFICDEQKFPANIPRSPEVFRYLKFKAKNYS